MMYALSLSSESLLIFSSSSCSPVIQAQSVRGALELSLQLFRTSLFKQL